MAFDDLRSFLHALDQQGQLLKISEEVNAEPDLAAAANATGRIGDGAPALWFDNIRGFTDARVAMNTIGSWQNHAISLGLPPNTPVKKQIDEFIRRWDNFPVAPERRANPGWAENTVDGDAINLFDILPLFRLNDGDGGFYLDKACVVSRRSIPITSASRMSASTVWKLKASVSWVCNQCRCMISHCTCTKLKSVAKICRLRSRWVTIRSLP